MGVDEVCASKLSDQPEGPAAPGERDAGLLKVRSEAPFSLQPSHAHIVPTSTLPSDLLQEVHLCAAYIEGGDDVEDSHI